jgi:hypothetical protein
VALSGAVDDQRNAIDYRKNLVSEFRKIRDSLSEQERIQVYLGTRQAGETDVRFADNIKSLSVLTDDCVFFSMELTDELTRSGNKLRLRNKFKFRLGVPKFLPADWSAAKQNDLLPDVAQYSDWIKNFKPYPTIRRRLLEWLRSRFCRAPDSTPKP